MAGDAVELEAAVVLVDFEEQLQEGDDADLLVKVRQLLDDVGEARDVLVVRLDRLLELLDLSAAQRVQQSVQPLVVRADERVQDVLVELNTCEYVYLLTSSMML